jgi:hypothetical protein
MDLINSHTGTYCMYTKKKKKKNVSFDKGEN